MSDNNEQKVSFWEGVKSEFKKISGSLHPPSLLRMFTFILFIHAQPGYQNEIHTDLKDSDEW